MKFEDAGFKSPEYLERFIKLQSTCANDFSVYGNTIVVETLERCEQRTAGGLILAELDNQHIGSTKDKANIFGVVLLTGGNVISNPNDYPGLSVGSVVQLPEFASVPYNKFPGIQGTVNGKIARCAVDEVKFVWKDVTSFVKCAKTLSE